MSTNISEGLPAKKKAAPVVDAPKGGQESGGKKGSTAENSAKRIRQAVYDIRYRARREDIDLKQAFSQYMSNTSMDQKDRAEVRAKLFGKGGGVSEQYVGASDDWALESFSKAFSTVFEHHQKDADGNTVPHDEIVTEYEKKLHEEKARKYKVRVTDPKTEKSYVRFADREKITQLRGKGLKVEMTEYGTPYEGERKKGEQTAKALGGGKKGKLDPVGKEDKDVNNDGKVNKTDSYLMNRRKAIGKAMAKEEVEQLDELSGGVLGSYHNKSRVDSEYGKASKNPEKARKRRSGQFLAREKIARKMEKMHGKGSVQDYPGMKFVRKKDKDKDKNQNEAFLADGTTSTEPSGKKINPTKVDNYKSGAVQIAPVDEADPSTNYGVKEEVEKKDNRANYAYINFMKNKLRAGMGLKNPMVMVDPDEAEKKFEKIATSTKATPDDEKEDACENALLKGAMKVLKNKKVQQALVSAGGLGTAVGGAKLMDDAIKDSHDLAMSDISKSIMEKGMDLTTREKLRNKSDAGDKGSVGSSGSDESEKPTPTITDTKMGDTPSTPSTGDMPSTPSTPSLKTDILKKDKVKPIQRDVTVNSSYDPLSNKEILGISEKILKKNFNLGEEGYDIARDEGRVKPSKDKKDATTMPPSKEMEKTRKKYKGPSAFEIVKKKYGKAVMDVDKKKKDKK